MAPKGRVLRTPTLRKFVVAGRGRVIQSPAIRDEIKKLTKKENPHVVYLGTATYDQEAAYQMQAAGFTDIGCTVEHLKLTEVKKSPETITKIKSSIRAADIIAVSGGNTLFAIKQWRKLGLDKLLKEVSEKGTVMCGGSAGAICWFDGGHSDSRDPTTLLHVDPNLTEEAKKSWSYICVKGLGLLPGICCPHHDTVQSNGVLRSDDFDQMLGRRHKKFPSEIGIGIEDQAAILIDGDKFKVLSTDGRSHVIKKKVLTDGSIGAIHFQCDDTFHSFSELSSPPPESDTA